MTSKHVKIARRSTDAVASDNTMETVNMNEVNHGVGELNHDDSQADNIPIATITHLLGNVSAIAIYNTSINVETTGFFAMIIGDTEGFTHTVNFRLGILKVDGSIIIPEPPNSETHN